MYRLRSASGSAQHVLLSVVVLLIVAGGGVAAWLMMRQPAQASSSPSQATAAAPSFDASRFKWPTLIQHLNDDTLDVAVKTDEAIFILYYLKKMNEVFGDPDMKVFIDIKCFTQVYDAEMTARLQAVFWTEVLPHALGELGAALQDERDLAAVMSERYPILADAVRNLSAEAPQGKVDRLFLLANLPKILETKAQQDALILFSEYGCANEVTQRVYANAVKFVKTYDAERTGKKEAP